MLCSFRTVDDTAYETYPLADEEPLGLGEKVRPEQVAKLLRPPHDVITEYRLVCLPSECC